MGLCLCTDKKNSSTVGDDDGSGGDGGLGGLGVDHQVPNSIAPPLTLDNFGEHDEVLFARPSHQVTIV